MSSLVSGHCQLGSIEDLETGDGPVTAGYDRIVALLRSSLTERELNLFAVPVADEAGVLVSWRARSGRALTPLDMVPASQRDLMVGERDRILRKVKSLADGAAEQGDAKQADIEILAALSVPSENDDCMFSDGFGPVLVNWGHEIEGDAAPIEAASPEVEARNRVHDPAMSDAGRTSEQEVVPEMVAVHVAVTVPEAVVGSEDVIAWSGAADDPAAGQSEILKALQVPLPKPLAAVSMAGAAVFAVILTWPEISTPPPPTDPSPLTRGEALVATLDGIDGAVTAPHGIPAHAPFNDAASPIAALSDDAILHGPHVSWSPATATPERPGAIVAGMFPAPRPVRPVAPAAVENQSLRDQQLGAVALAAADAFDRPELAIAQFRREPAGPLQPLALDGIHVPLSGPELASQDQPFVASDEKLAEIGSLTPRTERAAAEWGSQSSNRPVQVDQIADPSEGRFAVIEDDLGLSRRGRADLQLRLRLLGFDPRGIDGIFGPRTRAAISGWQQAHGHLPTGYLDAKQTAKIEDLSDGLFRAWQRRASALAQARAAKNAAEAERDRRIAAGRDRWVAAPSRRSSGNRTSPELRGIGPSRPGLGRAGSPREAIGEFVRFFPAVIDRIACETGRARCRRR